MLLKQRFINFLAPALLLQFLVFVLVFLDVPIARQVISFVYFTFIPGFVFLSMLKEKGFNIVEMVLFSIGLSIAFLMLAGLFINEFSLLLGYSNPLTLVPLMIVLNGLILMGIVWVYLKNGKLEVRESETIKRPYFMIPFILLPIISIYGAMCANIYGNNLILIFMIILISLFFISSVAYKKPPSNFYPLATFMIALALLCHSSLVSKYILPLGSDVPGEFFIFKITKDSAHWNATLSSIQSVEINKFNAMLSITILPTIYSVILKMDPTWIFKLLIPLIFALVPLGLYQMWQTYVGKKYAFISAFLFMSLETFYTEMLGLNRQMLAELFFVLLLIIITNQTMKRTNKIICFMIFGFAIVTAHYAVATIFLFFISFTVALLIVFRKPSKNVTVSMVAILSVLMFTWYIYVSKAATFDSFLMVKDYVYMQLGDFFNPASRGQYVLMGLGMAESPSIWNNISRFFSYITQAFIILGFISLITKRSNIPLRKELFIFNLLAMTYLALLILVPGLAETFKMTRFYHILLFFLAPLCVIGAEFIVSFLYKRKREFAVTVLLTAVLIPYFLFQTEFVFEIVGSDSWSIPLSGYRMNPLRLYAKYGYIDSFSVYGAHWLSNNMAVKNRSVYADEGTFINVLIAYATFYEKHFLSNITKLASNDVVYLSTLNVVYDMVPYGQLLWNTSELYFIFDDLNNVYSNGGSEIFLSP